MPQNSMRSKILEAGFRVIYANGYNGSSIQDITDAAAVPKGSFYNHFASKEDLAVEVLAIYREAARLDILADTTLAPLARLRAHVDFMCALWKSRGYREGCLLGNVGVELATTNPVLRNAVQGHFEQWAGAVATVLQEARAAGDLGGTASAKQLARIVIASWEGAVMSMKIRQSGQPLVDFVTVTLPALIGPAPKTRLHRSASPKRAGEAKKGSSHRS